jgi:predicted Ser/Thr protein kinase
LNDFVCRQRRSVEIAAERMSVVVREQHQLARAHVDRIFAIHSKLHLSQSDEVRRDDMTRRNQEGPAMVRGNLPVDAPGRSELRLEENSSSQSNYA